MDYTGEGVWGLFDYPEGVVDDARSAIAAGVDKEAITNTFGGRILHNLGVSSEIYPDRKVNEMVIGEQSVAEDLGSALSEVSQTMNEVLTTVGPPPGWSDERSK